MWNVFEAVGELVCTSSVKMQRGDGGDGEALQERARRAVCSGLPRPHPHVDGPSPPEAGAEVQPAGLARRPHQALFHLAASPVTVPRYSCFLHGLHGLSSAACSRF